MDGGISPYSIMRERGIEHFPPGVQEKLTLSRWFKDFEKEIGLDSMPFLANWYRDRFASLNANEPYPDEKWRRTVAILGLLATRFYTMDLSLPREWFENIPYARKTYTLTNISGINWRELTEIDDSFRKSDKMYYEGGKNPWVLRRGLADEFVGLFLKRVRELVESTGAKSSTEDIIKRNGELRSLIEEAQYYDSVALSNSFYEKLPEFVKKFESSKDPAVKYLLSVLQRRFINSRESTEWDLISKLFDSYFDHLSGLVKSTDKGTVGILCAEVSGYLKDLLKEVKRLQRRLNEYENDT